ncbi:hypothetical protein AVEN_116985-1 [Araneus ventricosus]|uniref:Uncharacterized protein n=1 Tax=Araneus ventricosus TaxID=182803 RepID=A0A4Y1ZWT8_ARAVE|nr:hypothetical protein AVEN_116985-1 [Araneus ventricosus]
MTSTTLPEISGTIVPLSAILYLVRHWSVTYCGPGFMSLEWVLLPPVMPWEDDTLLLYGTIGRENLLCRFAHGHGVNLGSNLHLPSSHREVRFQAFS